MSNTLPENCSKGNRTGITQTKAIGSPSSRQQERNHFLKMLVDTQKKLHDTKYNTISISMKTHLIVIFALCLQESFAFTLLHQKFHQPTSLNFFFGKQPAEEEKKVEKEVPVENEPDLVEKIFTVFFGKPEESPLGLKRFDENRFPEQYPATTTEFDVEPVDTDDSEMAFLRPLLKKTNLEKRGLRLTYDANRDGWDPLKFHAAVDRQGGGLVYCESRLGMQVGGYNPKGWVGYGEARGSIAAFLFQRQGNRWIKLKKVGGASFAQVDNPESGPSFGADSLVIPLSKDNPTLARSKLGSYFERMPDGGNSLFGKDASVQLKTLRVYHGVYGPDEYIPFTDAEPLALY